MLAELFKISRCSLYYQGTQEQKDLEFASQVVQVLDQNPCYGTGRLSIAMSVSENKVRRIKQKFNLYPVQSKRKPKKRRDSQQIEALYPNLVKDLVVLNPRTVYASDFTYIRFGSKFIYLATVLDLHTREIVGWSIGSRHTANLIKRALVDAITRTGAVPQIIHSDQGSEYKSKMYTSFVQASDIKISMSSKSSPWQNGFQESYYCGFKEDLGSISKITDLGVLIEKIHQTINYYNKTRIHTALRMSPHNFYRQHQAKQQELLKVG